MIDLCLFDLDDTLLRTTDLQEIREAGKRNNKASYKRELEAKLEEEVDRHIYTEETLARLRTAFPRLKLGVFTRAPKRYAQMVLAWAYPDFEWDVIIAYEDVRHTKPNGEGVDRAMAAVGYEFINGVLVVGDSQFDVRAAYHAGCWSAIDKSAWPSRWEWDHWKALELVPDVIITEQGQLFDVLENPGRYLPDLERELEEEESPAQTGRFDRLNHFIPRTIGGDKTAFPIYICGRSFSGYKSLDERRDWHALTKSIEENKDSTAFPAEWIASVRRFIKEHFEGIFDDAEVVVGVVPHRPGRAPRLENFLRQLQRNLTRRPIAGCNVTIQTDLLGYRAGVRSQHGEHLDHDTRFVNVRDHLYVRNAAPIKPGVSFLVIDDVVTTGASLIYARRYLKDAGASDVKCLGLAKNITDVL